MTNSPFRARVLVIDDEESVRDSFMATLMPTTRSSAALASAASALFDDAPSVVPQRQSSLKFEVDLATNGREAIWLVEQAAAKNDPYAVIFCDMRMPGWDGVETVERLRQVDQRAEVVFVTAYSDHSLESIVERAGANVGYFVKPFLGDEIRQLATKLVLDWNKARELESLMRTVTSLRGESGDVRRLVKHMLSEICAWLDTDSAALVRLDPSGAVAFELGVGTLSDQASALAEVDAARDRPRGPDNFAVTGATVLLPVEQVGFAVALCGSTKLTPDRKYMLQVFMEHAGLAIRNSDMQAKLVERERFAAVGEALSYVLHDVRGPVGTALMLTGLLGPGSRLPFPQEQLAERIQKQLKRAIGMLGDTLALCRETIVVQPTDSDILATYHEDLEALQQDLAARKVACEIDIPQGLVAHIDRERFWRVIWNLASNGALAAKSNPTPKVLISAALKEGRIALRVMDNGAGVPDAVLTRLFQPFVTGEPTGTGFGLTIVQRLVAAHGGEVGYAREHGWTCFTVVLPPAAA